MENKELLRQQLIFLRRRNRPTRFFSLIGVAILVAIPLVVVAGLVILSGCSSDSWKKQTEEQQRKDASTQQLARKNNQDIWNGATQASRAKVP